MKYFGLVVTFAVVLFCGVFYFNPTEPETINLDQSNLITNLAPDDDSSPERGHISKTPSIRQTIKEIPLLRITDAQKLETLETEVQEDEADLLKLAREYDTLRFNSESRIQHREKMQEKLALYSENILPIALEKIKSSQSAN